VCFAALGHNEGAHIASRWVYQKLCDMCSVDARPVVMSEVAEHHCPLTSA